MFHLVFSRNAGEIGNHEQLNAIVSALLRQQLGHEKVISVGILLRLGKSWNQQIALVSNLVRCLLEFHTEDRVMNAVAGIS